MNQQTSQLSQHSVTPNVMTLRRRILHAALAVSVVGALVALFWSGGSSQPVPKLSLEFLGYTTNGAKLATIKITNRGDRTVKGVRPEVVFEGSGPVFLYDPALSTNLPAGDSYIAHTPIYAPGGIGSETNRWRVRCRIERKTILNKLRPVLWLVPVIGKYAGPQSEYTTTSDWFEQ